MTFFLKCQNVLFAGGVTYISCQGWSCGQLTLLAWSMLKEEIFICNSTDLNDFLPTYCVVINIWNLAIIPWIYNVWVKCCRYHRYMFVQKLYLNPLFKPSLPKSAFTSTALLSLWLKKPLQLVTFKMLDSVPGLHTWKHKRLHYATSEWSILFNFLSPQSKWFTSI